MSFNTRKKIKSPLLPLNTAVPYWGLIADLEEGWKICDGTNGTPDLTGNVITDGRSEPDHTLVHWITYVV